MAIHSHELGGKRLSCHVLMGLVLLVVLEAELCAHSIMHGRFR